jgi:hypothetical protein
MQELFGTGRDPKSFIFEDEGTEFEKGSLLILPEFEKGSLLILPEFEKGSLMILPRPLVFPLRLLRWSAGIRKGVTEFEKGSLLILPHPLLFPRRLLRWSAGAAEGVTQAELGGGLSHPSLVPKGAAAINALLQVLQLLLLHGPIHLRQPIPRSIHGIRKGVTTNSPAPASLLSTKSVVTPFWIRIAMREYSWKHVRSTKAIALAAVTSSYFHNVGKY